MIVGDRITIFEGGPANTEEQWMSKPDWSVVIGPKSSHNPDADASLIETTYMLRARYLPIYIRYIKPTSSHRSRSWHASR
jgi:hypothetical protein